MTIITIALTKGRILKEALPLLAEIGIEPAEDVSTSRKLMFASRCKRARLLILRGIDVPTYVQFGAADLGVAGKDMIMEHGGQGFYEPLDLGISHCRMMTAGAIGVARPAGRIRVATKYLNVARSYYAEHGCQADVVKLYGALELAPLVALCDEIVDIVDTGNTLRANGLESRDMIANISARLIVNKGALKIKHASIEPLIRQLKVVVERGVG
jgi:ATP phosphoribosyltransferase